MSLSEVVGAAGLALYAEIALVLFLLAFALVAFQLVVRRGDPALERQGALPLDGDEKEPRLIDGGCPAESRRS